MDSELNNRLVIQHLLQKADELTNQRFGANSTVTLVGEEQYATAKAITVNAAASDHRSSNSRGVRVEEVDEATANQIIRSLQGANVQQEYQVIDAVSSGNTIVDAPATTYVSASSYAGELYQDPHPPQIIRRPPAQGPITYKQNIAVRFLQPPPVPPPGPLIIKEVRPPQPPAPRPLVIRQRAPPAPTPPPIVLRERPPRGPPPIPSQTVIKKLPPIPVPPRSVVVERFPPAPPRPRDVVIERWVPYSKEPQKRKIITYRAPPPQPYPAPRNTIIAYEPPQANVVRSIHRIGVQPQNPQEYALKHGSSLLDSSSLIAQVQNLGIHGDLSPPSSSYTQTQSDAAAEYYLSSSPTVYEPEYEYTTTSWENQQANNNEQVQVYWTDPYEDVRVILQRLGLSVD